MNRLKVIKKKHSGRDSTGVVVVRHQGGGHKRFLRIIDFKRDKIGVLGRVIGIEHDPNRNVEIALVQYMDGEKRYVLRPSGLNLNDVIASGSQVDIKVGNTLPISSIPIGTMIHNIELAPGRGGQMARGAGTAAMVMAKEGDFADLKLPSGEMRRIWAKCFATIGTLGSEEWKNRVIGKAGRNIHLGIRPTVRGVAQNPRSHPHGGGEGRSGIGMSTPKTYAGRPAVGKTRNKKKYSNKYILMRRKK